MENEAQHILISDKSFSKFFEEFEPLNEQEQCTHLQKQLQQMPTLIKTYQISEPPIFQFQNQEIDSNSKVSEQEFFLNLANEIVSFLNKKHGLLLTHTGEIQNQNGVYGLRFFWPLYFQTVKVAVFQ